MVEAVHNVLTARGRSAVFGMVTGIVVGALVFADLSTVGDLLRFQEDLRASGRNVAVVSSDEPILRRDQCEALRRQDWVLEAGSVSVLDGGFEATRSPGTTFRRAEVTVGLLRVWSGEPIANADVLGGLVLGTDAAAELGLAEDAAIGVLGRGQSSVGLVVDVEARNPAAARWVMEVVPPAGTAESCWVEFVPGALDVGIDVLGSKFADAAEVRPLLRLDEFSRDAGLDLQRRPQREAWIAAGTLIGLVGWLMAWFRRSEIGLYRAVGSRRTDVWLMSQIEGLVIVAYGGLLGVLWAFAAFSAGATPQPSFEEVQVIVRTAASTVMLAAILAPIGSVMLGRDQIASQLKDR